MTWDAVIDRNLDGLLLIETRLKVRGVEFFGSGYVKRLVGETRKRKGQNHCGMSS